MKSNPQQIKYQNMKLEKKINYIKGSKTKKKYIIKRVMVKIEIKNKLEGNQIFLFVGLN
jgi:hypothetical protein